SNRPAASGDTPSTVFTPAADSHVRSDEPSTNYGDSTTLRSDGSPIAYVYLRFDLTGSGSVSKATLKLHAAYDISGTGFDVRSVDDNSWGERTITYSNAPARGPVVASSGQLDVNEGDPISVDVSSHVKGDGPVT